MDKWRDLVIQTIHWLTELLSPVMLEGDWFDPQLRRYVNAECVRLEVEVSFDQRKDGW